MRGALQVFYQSGSTADTNVNVREPATFTVNGRGDWPVKALIG